MHLHTYYSDGEFSPIEVIRMAIDNNIKIKKLSLVDYINKRS